MNRYLKSAILALLLIVPSIGSILFAQTYALAPYGKIQYFNAAGTTPLAGGKLYTYAAGTTTPLVTYSDSSGTQNTNPVVLDSAGRASVYLSSANYKFILKTSADVTVWTQDNVQDTGITALANQKTNNTYLARFNSGSGLTSSTVLQNGTQIILSGVGTIGGIAAASSAQVLMVNDATSTFGISRASADGFGNQISAFKSRGSHGGQANIQNGDIILGIAGESYSGSSYFATGLIQFSVDGTFTSTQAPPSKIDFATNAANGSNTIEMTIDHSGLVSLQRSLVIGAATGGDKGVGTINTSADIYKNNTAFTSPDFVFEHYYSGSIVKFIANPGASAYHGLMPLSAVESYARTHYQLPDVGSTHGMFERADVLLRHTEELYLHLFELQHKIDDLEARLSKLENHQ